MNLIDPHEFREATLTVTTDGSGDFVGDTSKIRGWIHRVVIDNGTLAATADVTMVGKRSGVGILTQANVAAALVKHPVLPVHSQVDGAAVSGEYVAPYLHNEEVTITVAQGGDTLTGTITILYTDKVPPQLVG